MCKVGRLFLQYFYSALTDSQSFMKDTLFKLHAFQKQRIWWRVQEAVSSPGVGWPNTRGGCGLVVSCPVLTD